MFAHLRDRMVLYSFALIAIEVEFEDQNLLSAESLAAKLNPEVSSDVTEVEGGTEENKLEWES